MWCNLVKIVWCGFSLANGIVFGDEGVVGSNTEEAAAHKNASPVPEHLY